MHRLFCAAALLATSSLAAPPTDPLTPGASDPHAAVGVARGDVVITLPKVKSSVRVSSGFVLVTADAKRDVYVEGVAVASLDDADVAAVVRARLGRMRGMEGLLRPGTPSNPVLIEADANTRGREIAALVAAARAGGRSTLLAVAGARAGDLRALPLAARDDATRVSARDATRTRTKDRAVALAVADETLAELAPTLAALHAKNVVIDLVAAP